MENTQAAASAAASKLMLRFAGCASEFVAHSADSAAFSLRFATLRQQQAAGQVGRAVRQAGRERSLQSQSILSIRRTGMHWTFFVVSLTRSFLQHNSSNSTNPPPHPPYCCKWQRATQLCSASTPDSTTPKLTEWWLSIPLTSRRAGREEAGGGVVVERGCGGSSALSCFNRTHRLSNKSAAKFGFRCMGPREGGSSDAL